MIRFWKILSVTLFLGLIGTAQAGAQITDMSRAPDYIKHVERQAGLGVNGTRTIFQITTVSPDTNALDIAANSSIEVVFSDNVNATTVNSNTFNVDGAISGRHTGAFTITPNTIFFNPTSDFETGEVVTVTLTRDIEGPTPGDTLLTAFTWQFTIEAPLGYAQFPDSNRFGPSNDNTLSVALGDVEGDGDLDLAVGNDNQQSVIYLNDGAGHFSFGSNFGTNSDQTRSVAFGDADGDGDLDLAVGNYNQQNMVYLNDGAGNFTVPRTFGTGSDGTWSVAFGDADGDGALDLAVGNISSQNVVYLNDGLGNFTAGVRNFGTSFDYTRSVAFGDVDSDGDLDLAVGNYNQQNVVYLNDGAGNFTAGARNFGAGSERTESVVFGDVDGDSDLDLAVGNANSQQNVVYLNDGMGNFTAGMRNFGTGVDFTYSVAFGDADGDGDLDLAVGNSAFEQSVVYLNNGVGFFTDGARNFGLPKQTASVLFGDMDGDSDLDLVVGNYNGQNVVCLNALPQEMDILGGLSSIPDGDTTPALNDSTDYGSVVIGGSKTQTFKIKNIAGGLPLTIGAISFGGTNQGDFSVVSSPAATINGGDSTNFTVRFTPGAAGARNATISIVNNDSNENPYDFALSGTGIAPLGNALDFDGSDDRVIVTGPINLANQSFTVEFWARRNTSISSDMVIGQGTNTNNVGLHIGFREPGGTSNNRFTFGFYFNDLDADSTYTDLNWHHWACVYDAVSNSRKIYRDGTQVAFDTASNDYQGTGNLIIGVTPWNIPYDMGDITVDELRVWNVARTSGEIQANRNIYLQGNESGLQAYYRFDQGNAGQDNTGLPVQLLDYTNNCRTGVLTNFARSGSTSNWVSTGNPGAPILATSAVTSIGETSAISGGDIFDVGNHANVTQRGICWSTTTCPDVFDSKTVRSGTFGVNSYPDTLTGLSASTLYYVRAYAIAGTDTSYGEAQGFTTVAPEIDVRGNSVSITDGDNTPDAADSTYFGSVLVGAARTVTYSIHNTGTQVLNVSAINKSGTGQSKFAIGALTPASSIAISGSATFMVTYTPTAVVSDTAFISITNTDSDENPYNFSLSGTGLLPTPNAPTNLYASGAYRYNPVANQLWWTDNSSDETGFVVERSTTSGAGFALIATTAANVSTFTDTAVSAGTLYFYRVRATNAGVTFSAYTNEAEAAPVLEAGKAVTFDGNGDYVQMTEFAPGMGDFTIECWANFNNFNTGQYLITNRTNEATSSGNWYVFNVQSDSLVVFEMALAQLGPGHFAMWSATPLTRQRWYHLAVTRSGANVSLYVDGLLAVAQTDVGVRDMNSPANVTRLGGAVEFNSVWLNGQMDEVRFWSVARSAAQIKTDLHKPLLGNESGLVNLWHFDEVSGPAYDATLTANNATLNGNAERATSRAMHPFQPANLIATPGNSQITLGWNRNTETDYKQYNIITSTNSNLSGGVTTTNTTITDTTEVLTGLTNGTLYYFGVAGVDSAGQVGDTLIVSATPGPVVVTATIGVTGPFAYPTLKDAFDAINAGTHQGNITITVYDNTTETATAQLNASGSGGASYSGVSIVPGSAALKTIAMSAADTLIFLNGADNVTFDGRFGGSGQYLQIQNSAIAGRTLFFLNNADNNAARYCIIEGAATSTGFSTAATILIGGDASAVPDGNDNIIFDNCDIRGAARAYYLISVESDAGAANDNVTLTNSRIYNFDGFGFWQGSNGGSCVISGNSFYDNGTSSETQTAIDIRSGNSHLISNNAIGGSASSAAGLWTKTTSGAYGSFTAIRVGATGGSSTRIVNNTIRNVAWSSFTSDLVNEIITTSNSSSYSVRGNTIADISIPETTNQGVLRAIYNGASATGTDSLSDNTIRNLSNRSSHASAEIVGIYQSSGGPTLVIHNNVIHSLSDSSTAVLPIIGVYLRGTAAAAHSIRNNTIYGLSLLHTSATGRVAGIFYEGLAAGTRDPLTVIRENRLYDFQAASDSASVRLSGIELLNMAGAVIANNMISLGGSEIGDYQISGIYKNSDGNLNAAYNSVYIGGNLSSGATNTQAIYRQTAPASGNDSLRNNIFINERSGGTGKHFAIVSNSTTGLYSNTNDLYSGAAANLGSYDNGATARAFAAWKSGTAQDICSINSDVTFTAESTADLHTSTAALGVGVPMSGLATDYDGNSRHAIQPSIGADEVSPAAKPEINLRGNGAIIADGDFSPTTTDSTDFGARTVGDSLKVTYTIQNANLTGSLTVNAINKTGTGASKFSIGPLTPAGAIAAGGSATFVVTYKPTAAVSDTAFIQIPSDDCDEPFYDFAVRGTGLGIPKVTSFSPTSVNVGATVTISGRFFGNNADSVKVYIGGMLANITGLTENPTTFENTIQVTTPPGAATYAPMTAIHTTKNASSSTLDLPANQFLNVKHTSVINIPMTYCATDIPNGTAAHGLVIGNLDNDGKPDVVVSNNSINSLRFYRNTTTGAAPAFVADATLASGTAPTSMSLGDIDNDGRLDLAVACNNGGNAIVSVYRNLSSVGAISFQAKQDFTGVNGQNLRDAKIQDVDGDGKPDLIITNQWNSGTKVSVLKNTHVSGNFSAGTFAPKVDFTVVDRPAKLAMADFDGDGKVDLAVSNNTNSSRLSIFRNTSASGFIDANSFAAAYNISLTGSWAHDVHAADFDGDGKTDIVIGENNAGSMKFFRNTSTIGNLSFATSTIATGWGGFNIQIGDLNSDGKVDVIASMASGDGTDWRYYENTSTTGTISFAAPQSYSLSAGIYEMAAQDMNADGKPDVIMANGAFITIIDFSAPNIGLAGNGVAISDGDATPNAADSTDFGVVAVNGSRAVTYKIHNTGADTLHISGMDTSGPDSLKFTFGAIPTRVNPNDSTTFTVTYAPGGVAGADTAQIIIFNDDCDEGTYDFAVSGTGATPAAALDFDGGNDVITVADNPALQFGVLTDFSLEARIKLDGSQANYAGIIAKASTGFWTGFQLVLYQNKIAAELRKEGSNFAGVAEGLVGTTNLNDNNWHHIAMTVQRSSQRIILYRDGVVEANVSHAAAGDNLNSSAAMLLGIERESAWKFNGILDEVRIWNKARTCAEINHYMNCELTGSENGLVAYYNFNQGIAGGSNSGVTTLTDLAGGDNNGTLNGFALSNATSNWITPGGVTTGTSCPAFAAPEIALLGGLTAIDDGDTLATDTADSTSYGSVIIYQSVTHTFKIKNTGADTLHISSVTISGTSEFALTTSPNGTVVPGDSTTFRVRYLPTDSGGDLAKVRIWSDDCDEGTYDFAVSGASQNQPPTVVAAIADISATEDDPALFVADLDDAFADDRDTGNLSFSIIRDGVIFNAEIVDVLIIDFAADAAGTDTLILRAADTQGGVVFDTVRVTIAPVNDAPVVIAALPNLTVEEDAPDSAFVDLNDVFYDPEDGSDLFFTIINNSNPTVVTVTVSAADSVLTLNFQDNAVGTSVLIVEAGDSGAGVRNALAARDTFTVTVNPVNDAPSFTVGGNTTVFEDSGQHTFFNWATNIKSGPANESGQTLAFTISNNRNALFSIQPALAANGTLTFTPAADSSGTSTIFVQLRDNGGTANGGKDSTLVQTFTITVNNVNDAPSFTAGGNLTVNEDAGGQTFNWATNISAGPGNESGQSLAFTISNNRNSLFSVQPALAANGTLTFTLAADSSGTATVSVQLRDNGGTANGGKDSTLVQTFTITINNINDAPSIVNTGNRTHPTGTSGSQSVNWVTGFTPGPANESGQALQAYLIRNLSDPNDIIAVDLVTVSVAGTLSYTLTGRDGQATLNIRAQDNGGTANAGVDTSAAYPLLISVTNNTPPTMTAIAAETTLEDQPTQAIPFMISDEFPGSVTVTGHSSNTFLVPPDSIFFTGAGGAVRTVSIHPCQDQFGSVTITVRLADTGGTILVTDSTFVITVMPVNDAPSFTLSSVAANAIVVNEDAGPQTIANLVATSAPGPGNEQSQTLAFTVSNNHSSLFSVQPALSANDTLTFTPAADSSGTATIYVQLRDNGGTANGGTDSSAVRSVYIVVNAVNDPPVTTTPPNVTINPGEPLNQTVFFSDADNNGPYIVCVTIDNPSVTAAPACQTLALAGNATYTLTAMPYFYGVVTVTVTITDNVVTRAVTTTSYTVTFNNINDAPRLAATANQTMPEDTVRTLTVTYSDPDSLIPADTHTLSVVSDNSNLIVRNLTGATSGATYQLVPAANWSGAATITVTVRDSSLSTSSGQLQDTKTYLMTVTNVNDAPVIMPVGNQVMAEDAVKEMRVIFTDADTFTVRDTHTISVTSSTTNVAIQNKSGNTSGSTYVLAPAANWIGTAQITVTVSDGNGGAASETYTLTVTNDNDPPTITDVAFSQTMREDTTLTMTIDFADRDASDTHTFVITSADPQVEITPGSGALVSGMSYVLKPAANWYGQTFITVLVQDNSGLFDTNIYELTVANINDAPVLTKVANPSTAQATPLTMTANFSDPDVFDPADSHVLTVTSSQPDNVKIRGISGNTTGSTYVLEPQGSWNGAVNITVKVTDTGAPALSDSQTYTLTVSNKNDAPVLQTLSSVVFDEDTVRSLSLTFTDDDTLDSHSLTFTSTQTSLKVQNRSAITKSDAKTRRLTYDLTPDANWHGEAEVTVTVTDNGGGGLSDSRTYPVTVRAVNDPPVIAAIAAQTVAEDTPVELGFSFTDEDIYPPKDEHTVTITADTTAIRVGNIAVGTPPDLRTHPFNYRLTPDPDWYGKTTIRITVSEAGARQASSVSQTYTLTVSNVNDTPVLTETGDQVTAENTVKELSVVFTDADTFTTQDEHTVTITSSDPSHVAVSDIGAGPHASGQTYTLTPADDWDGSAEITVEVDDNNGGVASETYTLTVTNENSPPEITSDLISVVYFEGDPLKILNPGIQLSDADGDDLSGVTIHVVENYVAGEDSLFAPDTLGLVRSGSLLTYSDSASPEVYSDILRRVGYLNKNDVNPNDGLRIVEFAVNDETDSVSSRIAIHVIRVNDPPILSARGRASYTEDGPPIVVNSALTLEDPDGPDMRSAQVRISGGFQAGEDSLFVPSNLLNGLTAQPFDKAGGVLTLEASSARPAAVFQTVLRAVRYVDTNSGNPSPIARLVEFIVNDGFATVSDTTIIVLQNVNDGPYVAQAINDIVISEDAAVTPVNLIGVFRDPDHPAAVFTYAIFNNRLDLLSVTPDLINNLLVFNLTENANGLAQIVIQATSPVSRRNETTVADTFTISIQAVNDPPTIKTAIPPQTAVEDSPFQFTFADTVFSDADRSDGLVYSAGFPAAWLRFNPLTRTFTGTPANADVGEMRVTLTATDNSGAKASALFDLQVRNTNDPPMLHRAIPDLTAEEGDPFSFQFADSTFVDEDAGDRLNYEVALVLKDGQPPVSTWHTFNSATRTFSGTPQNRDIGLWTFAVKATDNSGAAVSDTFNIRVKAIDLPPRLTTAIADQPASEDQPFSLRLAADTFVDDDPGDSLSYRAELADGSPLVTGWLRFNPDSLVFSGLPLNADVGSWPIRVIAADRAGSSASDSFVITVNNTNDAPKLVKPLFDPPPATENQDFLYNIPAGTFVDDDEIYGDQLTYTADLDGAGWLRFDGATRTFFGRPTNDDAGLVRVQVTVTDLSKATATDDFTISVGNVNRPPQTLGSLSAQTAQEDSQFELTIPANFFTDPDPGDTLTYAVVQANGRPLAETWLGVDPRALRFSGIPGNANVPDTLFIKIIAKDQHNAADSATFRLTVVNVNDPPILKHALGDMTTDEDALFKYIVPDSAFADDDVAIDLDRLRYTARQIGVNESLPAWLHFSAATQAFIGVPGNADVGTVSIEITVTDSSQQAARDTFTVTIHNVNDRPEARQAIPNINATEDVPFVFTFADTVFFDQDAVYGDTLRYEIVKPASGWFKLDPTQPRRFIGTPLNENVGLSEVTLRAIDIAGDFADTQFRITAVNVDDSPTIISAMPDTTFDEDSPVFSRHLRNVFVDVDKGDTLRFTAVSGNSALIQASVLAQDSLLLKFALNANGSTSIILTATANGQSIADTFRVHVRAVNDPPVLRHPIGSKRFPTSERFTFTISDTVFHDADGDTLQFTAQMSDDVPWPDSLTYNVETRTFAALFTNESLGQQLQIPFPIAIKATDPAGAAATDLLTLIVFRPVPELIPPGIFEAVEAQPDTLQFTGQSLTRPTFTFLYGQGDQPLLLADTLKTVADEWSSISKAYQLDVTLPADIITSAGLWYQLQITNDYGTIYEPADTTRQSVQIHLHDFASILAQGVNYIRTGIPANEWYTVGLPFNAAVELDGVLGRQKTNNKGEPTNWRVQLYNTDTESMEDRTRLENKRGYFLKHKGDPTQLLPLNDSGQPDANFTVTTNPLGTFEGITLQPGWNLVAWPYTYPAAYEWIDPDDVNEAIYFYRGKEQWLPVDTLLAFGGYAIFNKSSGSVKIGEILRLLPLTQAKAAILSQSATSDQWLLRWQAYNAQGRDSYNYLGTANAAADQMDRYDAFEPPIVGSALTLYFPHNRPGSAQSDHLCYDIKSDAAAGHTWDMTLENHTAQPLVTLEWDRSSLPTGRTLAILDVTLNRWLDDDAASYRFDSHTRHAFKVLVGTAEFVEAERGQLAGQLPHTFALAQNYPNPFNPTTTVRFALPRSGDVTLKVYNAAGQLVKILADAYFETGFYDATWAGQNDAGQAVSSGVYFYRLEVRPPAGNFGQTMQETKRMLLLK